MAAQQLLLEVGQLRGERGIVVGLVRGGALSALEINEAGQPSSGARRYSAAVMPEP